MYPAAPGIGWRWAGENEKTALPGERGMELPEKYIKNTKLVPNRTALLEHFPKNAVVAEIGVAEGSYAEKILSITRPRILHLIDAWESERFGEDAMQTVLERFKDPIESGQVVVHRGRSQDVLKTFEDNTFDWVYLDTSHKYGDTLEELELCRRKVKEDGLIAGHDYTAGNVSSALRYGVVEAVNETCVKHDLEMAFLSNEAGRYLSFAIRNI